MQSVVGLEESQTHGLGNSTSVPRALRYSKGSTIIGEDMCKFKLFYIIIWPSKVNQDQSGMLTTATSTNKCSLRRISRYSQLFCLGCPAPVSQSPNRLRHVVLVRIANGNRTCRSRFAAPAPM